MQNSASNVLRDLLEAVKQCQIRFGSRTELATDSDPSVQRLCSVLDTSFSHGLKTNVSLLRNVTDLVFSSGGGGGATAGGTSGNLWESAESDTFWDFALPNLSSHEKERFNTLRYVSNERGKGRALIRAALNERSLERYILMWLNAPNLAKSYECWALLREAESANLLPSIAAGLSSILFAVKVDYMELNVLPAAIKSQRSEPIIAAPRPSLSKSTAAHKRHLVSFDDPEEVSSSISSLSSATSAPGKSLASMCLKFPDSVAAVTNFAPEPSFPEKVASHNPTSNGNPQRLASITVEPELPSAIQYSFDFRASVTTNTSSSAELESTQDDSIEVSTNEDYGNDVFAIEEDYVDNRPETTTTTSTSSRCSSSSSSIPKPPSEDVEKLRSELSHMVERCSYLENQMAELSL